MVVSVGRGWITEALFGLAGLLFLASGQMHSTAPGIAAACGSFAAAYFVAIAADFRGVASRLSARWAGRQKPATISTNSLRLLAGIAAAFAAAPAALSASRLL